MSWTISGNYLAGCSCAVMCGCPFDGQPRDSEGNVGCLGSNVFHVAEGNLDDVDLSGVDFVLYNEFPSNLTSGNWKIGVVVDTGASDEQADAIERILSGREGGPFGELSQFYGEYLGLQRAHVTLGDGERPFLKVEGRTELSYTSLTGPDGKPTTVKNATFGFAPEFEVGTTTGRSEAFGLSFEGNYGETGHYVFSSEEKEDAAKGRG
jgi:hypothetical protein